MQASVLISKNPDNGHIEICIEDISKVYMLYLESEKLLLELVATLCRSYVLEFKSLLDERLCCEADSIFSVQTDPWVNGDYGYMDFICNKCDLVDSIIEYIEEQWLKK